MKRLSLENERLAETGGAISPRRVIRTTLGLTLLVLLSLATLHSALAQEQSNSQQRESKKTEPTKEGKQAAPEHEGFGKQLAEETRESTGDDKEDNANLKHASPIRWMARKTGLSDSLAAAYPHIARWIGEKACEGGAVRVARVAHSHQPPAAAHQADLRGLVEQPRRIGGDSCTGEVGDAERIAQIFTDRAAERVGAFAHQPGVGTIQQHRADVGVGSAQKRSGPRAG